MDKHMARGVVAHSSQFLVKHSFYYIVPLFLVQMSRYR